MQRFRSILFSPLGRHDNPTALRRVVDLAQRNQATITLFSAAEELPMASRFLGHRDVLDRLAAADRSAEQHRLSRLASQCGAAGADIVIEPGNTALTLIMRVLTAGHDLVVVTTDDDREDNATIKRLLRKCPCPVWVIRPTRARKLRVLAAVNPDPDEAELNRAILELAASTVDLHRGELHVAHAFELFAEHLLRSPTYGAMSDAEVDELRNEERTDRYRDLMGLLTPSQAVGADWQVHVVNGPAAEAISELVTRHRINLLVLGTVARSGLSGLLMGNTAERILDDVTCSVLAVKPPGFVSPIAPR